MRRKLATVGVVALGTMAMLGPAGPAHAACAFIGEDGTWDRVEVCVEGDGTCVEVWAMSGPREFPIWDTCP